MITAVVFPSHHSPSQWRVMVLAELGKGLTTALAKLQTTTVIDDDVVNEIIKEVSNALLHVRECSGSVNDSPM